MTSGGITSKHEKNIKWYEELMLLMIEQESLIIPHAKKKKDLISKTQIQLTLSCVPLKFANANNKYQTKYKKIT